MDKLQQNARYTVLIIVIQEYMTQQQILGSRYWVVDTGATISGISESVALQLGYDPSDPYYIDDFDTAGGIEEKMPMIKISRMEVHNQYLEKPIVSCNKHFDEINIHGVLGLDFLAQYNLIINFDENFMQTCNRKTKVITP